MATILTSGRAPLRKRIDPAAVAPNLIDYDAERAAFTWEEARAALDGLPHGRGLNVAHEAVDRHANGARAGKTALRWLGRHGSSDEITYGRLAAATSRFANLLVRLGLERGDRVFALTGRIPELYTAALGTLKFGGVFSPLFAAFGPGPVRERLLLGDARVLVTTPAIYRAKVAPLRAELPALEHVLLVGGSEEISSIPGALDLRALLAEASPAFEIAPTDPGQPALLHFTSGTTGRPKGAVHVHEAVVAHHATGRLALDLHSDDVFWCTADPGWVTGTSYGIFAPLTHGVTSIVDEADFDARRWYRILAEQQVTVWYTAPTAIRMLMSAGPELAARAATSARCASSRASASRSTRRRWSGATRPSACRSTTTGGRPRPAGS